MTLNEIMSKRIITKDTQTPIWEVARVMCEYDIGFVPITSGKKIVGIITDRDIAIKCVKENYDSSKKVEEFMTKEVITIDILDSVNDVLRKMAKHKIKRILITEDNLIVGVISLSDIIMHYDVMTELMPTLQSIWNIEENDKEQNVDVKKFEL